MGAKRKEKTPKEGSWFPIADAVTQHCCQCGSVHLWEFREWSEGLFIDRIYRPESLEVRITRIK